MLFEWDWMYTQRLWSVQLRCFTIPPLLQLLVSIRVDPSCHLPDPTRAGGHEWGLLDVGVSRRRGSMGPMLRRRHSSPICRTFVRPMSFIMCRFITRIGGSRSGVTKLLLRYERERGRETEREGERDWARERERERQWEKDGERETMRERRRERWS